MERPPARSTRDREARQAPRDAAESKLRVLALDIEGGYGGSSRSLYESIRHMDRGRATVEVWCRRPGPVQDRYAAIGVPCRVVPAMPKVSALPRLSRNLYVFARAFADFAAARVFRAELVAAIHERFDLVHFNHEALFLQARWLRRRTRVPFTMHVRTNLHDTPFARWQTRVTSAAIDRLVFISENERTTFESLARRPAAGRVIYNIVAPAPDEKPHPQIPADGRFKIACLSNFSWYRGLDRLAEVAERLMATGRRDVLFVMAGDMGLSRSLPGELGSVARAGGTLADYMARRGVGGMFLFLGHVAEPEGVLAACHALVKPTRENNPWGRDILEALAAGRPVFGIGCFDRFVESGRTGFLQPVFDGAELADKIVELADDRALCARMGEEGARRIAELCNGPEQASALLDLWDGVWWRATH